jgi:multiple sugar transport system ATP-binding protein
MPALRLEGIAKTFATGHAAISGVDLEISEGELVVLLGPSGCGKSTLLRIVAGVEVPTAGRVLIDGDDVTQLPPQKRDVAMVFQNYALYPHMSVRDNLAFGLRMRGTPRDVIGRRVAEVAEILGIANFLDRKPAQLSGGQRQRVALGRAIARQAKVFLLDEPLSNLDAQLRAHTRTELARLHHSLHVPMLYVTHDQEEAMTLGDRVVVMRSGRFLQIGPPMEIYGRPATRFVGEFVGSPRMNLLPGRLTPLGGGGVQIDGLGGGLQLAPGMVGGGRAAGGAPAAGSGQVQDVGRAGGSGEAAGGGQPVIVGRDVDNVRALDGGRAREPRAVVVGIRPEDIEVVEPADGDLLARADVVEPLGRESLLHLVTGERAGDPQAELRVLAAAPTPVRPGARIGLRLRRERIHLFDPSTEERLTGFA